MIPNDGKLAIISIRRNYGARRRPNGEHGKIRIIKTFDSVKFIWTSRLKVAYGDHYAHDETRMASETSLEFNWRTISPFISDNLFAIIKDTQFSSTGNWSVGYCSIDINWVAANSDCHLLHLLRTNLRRLPGTGNALNDFKCTFNCFNTHTIFKDFNPAGPRTAQLGPGIHLNNLNNQNNKIFLIKT